jgi:type IV secretion system protein TrbL
MNDTGVIDTFFATFNRYIDSGFGLLGGEVGALANILVAIDMTLAALMWSMASGEDVLARLIRKVLYIGFFAFLIGNFHSLSTIVLESFTGLGLKASGVGVSAQDLLRPGKLAALGLSAGKPLLESASELGGFPGIFENFVQVLVLLVGFLLVVVAFFVMAVQMFVVLIEFKLTALAGFVLVPFGLFGRTAFLAEKVLGTILTTGVKVLVLAVVAGIGSTLFDQFTATWDAGQPTLEQILALSLAAVTLLGLSIFCPGIAAGLVTGAPQLGAGAAAGTGLAIGGMAMAGAAAVGAVVGAGGAVSERLSAGAVSAGAGGRAPPAGGDAGGGGAPPPAGGGGGDGGGGVGRGPAAPAGGGSSASARPAASATAESSSASDGAAGEGAGGGSAAGSPSDAASKAQGKAAAAEAGGAGWQEGPHDPGGAPGAASAATAQAQEPPDWAKTLRDHQALTHGLSLAAHTLASGDAAAGGASPSLSED